MARGYSTAKDAVIWMGESPEQTDKLFKTMDILFRIGDRALESARGSEGELEQDRLTPWERSPKASRWKMAI